jgi:hypothetical protein
MGEGGKWLFYHTLSYVTLSSCNEVRKNLQKLNLGANPVTVFLKSCTAEAGSGYFNLQT